LSILFAACAKRLASSPPTIIEVIIIKKCVIASPYLILSSDMKTKHIPIIATIKGRTLTNLSFIKNPTKLP